jgi:hypothetical protein
VSAADVQLARIAEIAPPPPVRIYKLAREFDWWAWLCPEALQGWLARGWQVRETRDVTHLLTCDDHGPHEAAA